MTMFLHLEHSRHSLALTELPDVTHRLEGVFRGEHHILDSGSVSFPTWKGAELPIGPVGDTPDLNH
jgi:hypothetical protein